MKPFAVGLFLGCALLGCSRTELSPLDRASNAFEKGEFAESVQMCDQLINSSDSSDVRLLRGRGLMALKKHEQALAEFSTAVQLDPKNPKHWYFRERAHRALGNDDAAWEDAKRARKLDPNFAAAFINEVVTNEFEVDFESNTKSSDTEELVDKTQVDFPYGVDEEDIEANTKWGTEAEELAEAQGRQQPQIGSSPIVGSSPKTKSAVSNLPRNPSPFAKKQARASNDPVFDRWLEHRRKSNLPNADLQAEAIPPEQLITEPEEESDEADENSEDGDVMGGLAIRRWNFLPDGTPLLPPSNSYSRTTGIRSAGDTGRSGGDSLSSSTALPRTTGLPSGISNRSRQSIEDRWRFGTGRYRTGGYGAGSEENGTHSNLSLPSHRSRRNGATGTQIDGAPEQNGTSRNSFVPNSAAPRTGL